MSAEGETEEIKLAEGETVEAAATTEETSAETPEASKSAGTPVKIVARTGGVAVSSYFGPCVHDLAGMRAPATLPLDYCHDTREVIGHAVNPRVEGDSLSIEGFVLPFKEGDRASEVLFRAKNGTPYQASIQMSENYKYVFLARDQSLPVNGQTVEGPCTVFTEWELIGVAICPYGVDINTSVGFGDAPEEPETMSDDAEETPEAMSDEEKPADTSLSDEEKPKDETSLSDDEEPIEGEKVTYSQSQIVAQGQKFRTAFGVERGADYFSRGLSFAQAQTQFAKDVAAENAALKEQLQQTQKVLGNSTKPVGFSLGEPDKTETAATKFSESLSPGMAKFASGIKLPAK